MDESFTLADEAERWLAVPDWEGFYEVSNKGRMRNVDRVVNSSAGRTRRNPSKIMRTYVNRDGNPTITLQGDGRRHEKVAVHLLVQRAFGSPLTTVAPPDPGEPEQWLPIAGFEGLYSVSDLGRVRSFHRGKGKGKRGGVLRANVAGKTNIHLRVVLHGKDGKRTTRLVHQLVMEAFAGLRPAGQEVCHGPGGVLDNRLVNLSYGTSSKNNGVDKWRDGTLMHGESHTSAILTEQIVIVCRRRYADGETCRVLAAEFGVTRSTMSEAVTGESWAWIPDAIPKGSKAYHKKGAEHHAAKITPEIVKEIRARSEAGEVQYVIAARYGVSQSTVWRTIHGHTWTSAAQGHQLPPRG